MGLVLFGIYMYLGWAALFVRWVTISRNWTTIRATILVSSFRARYHTNFLRFFLARVFRPRIWHYGVYRRTLIPATNSEAISLNIFHSRSPHFKKKKHIAFSNGRFLFVNQRLIEFRIALIDEYINKYYINNWPSMLSLHQWVEVYRYQSATGRRHVLLPRDCC